MLETLVLGVRAVVAVGLFLIGGGVVQAMEPEHNVGIRQFTVPYYGLPIDAAIWYPTERESRSIDAVSVLIEAAPDAPIKPGKYPLLVLSHGTGGMKLNHYPFAQAFAKAGYVVVSLTHPGDNFRDRSMIADPRYFYERPRQISRVIDFVLANPDWAVMVDQNRIAALGHSAGGYAVAAMIGAIPNLDRLESHCRKTTDDPACDYADPALGILEQAGPALKLPEQFKPSGDLRDARIKAAILLAPLGAVVEPGSLARTQIPVRLIGAEHDEILARRYHFDYLAAELQGPQADSRTRVSIARNAGHFSFLAPFKPAFIEATRSTLGAVVVPRPGVNRASLQQSILLELRPWLREALLNP